MPCYRPVTVFKPLDGGAISYRELPNCREIQIPCSRCIGCRIASRDAWAFRCYAESKMHKNNQFVTLTYDDEHLPADESLNKRDWQLFAKRLRKRLGPFRFYMCGEYGEQFGRPHYHALLFGVDFPDRMRDNSIYAKEPLYKSELLDELWGKGHCTFGEVTFESARYCAEYTTTRLSDHEWLESGWHTLKDGTRILRAKPFGNMSRRPGIGASWFAKYWPEVATHGGVFCYDRKLKIPQYFDDLLEQISPDDFDRSKLERSELAKKFIIDNTRDRLEVKEACTHAKSNFYKEKRNHAL